MTGPPFDEESVFNKARLIEDPVARSEYLRFICPDDSAVGRLEALLRVHEHSTDGFLDSPADAALPQLFNESLSEGPGTVIGSYKLLEQIGEGGFGVVFMAEQTEPIRRKVALKVVKPGMDTRQVIARFEAERQALALMDHPNIASVLGGGATESGRPYFVMELVRGVPLTQYADDHQLAVPDRLSLFMDVCRAVHHAHQKGIIHRDLKPTNILVTVLDGRPIVKVIDFGVAKATGQQLLTDKTLFTGFAQMIGTPLYMSPEQAELSSVDVDTRSDIYSLGVLLYELLTGSTPFDRERLKDAAYDEIRRIIREEDPPKPSTRLSSLTDTLPSVAAHRGLDPRKLCQLLDGDLDWIVMKALEKDRGRRYESANGFLRDLERYLGDEPVEARPPGGWYRFHKMVRRNQRLVATAALLTVVACAMMGTVGWAIRDRYEVRRKADQDRARQLAELGSQISSAIAEARTSMAAGRYLEARSTIKQADALASRNEVGQVVRRQVEQTATDLDMIDLLEQIRLDQSGVLVDGFDVSGADPRYSQAFREYGIDVERLELSEAAARIIGCGIRSELAAALDDWSYVRRLHQEKSPNERELILLAAEVDPDPVKRTIRTALAENDYDALVGMVDETKLSGLSPSSIVTLSRSLLRGGRSQVAVKLLRAGQTIHPQDFWINACLAHSLRQVDSSNARELVRCYSNAVAVRPQSAGARHDLSLALRDSDSIDEALRQSEIAVELAPHNGLAYYGLARCLIAHGRREEAVAVMQSDAVHDPDFPNGMYFQAEILEESGRFREAEEVFRESARRFPNNLTAQWAYGDFLERHFRHNEAVDFWRTAILRNPNNAYLHDRLGVALKNQDKHAEALIAYKKACSLSPKSSHARLQLGRALLRTNRVDEAIKELRNAVQLDPKNAQFLNDAAWALIFVPDPPISRPQEALEFATRAVQLGGNYDNLRTLGAAQVRCGQWKEALDTLTRCMTQRPGNKPTIWFLLSMAHWNLGNRSEARAYFDRAATEQAKPNRIGDDRLSRLRGEASAMLGLPGTEADVASLLASARHAVQDKKWDRAASGFDKALSQIITAKGYQSFRKTLCFEIAQHDQLYRRVVKLRPDDRNLPIGYARRLIFEKKWLAAADVLKPVLEQVPLDDVHFEYAGLLLLCGEADQYERHVTRLYQRTRHSRDVFDMYVLGRACSLAPQSSVPMSYVIECARYAVNNGRHAWYLYSLALAHYRNGDYAKAIERADESRSVEHWPIGAALNWLLAAMAHHQLGHSHEATLAFNRAERYLNLKPSSRKSPEIPIPPSSLIDAELLRSEASQLLSGKKVPVHVPPESVVLGRVRQLVSEKQHDAAAKLFLEHLSNVPRANNRGKRLCEKVVGDDRLFESLISQASDQRDLWRARITLLVRDRRWRNALKAYERFVDHGLGARKQFEHACAYLLANDPRGHARVLESMTRDSQDDVFQLARTAAIAPKSSVSPRKVVDWARRAVEHQQHAWHYHVLALAHLRAGEPALAIREAQQANARAWHSEGKSLNWLVMSLASHQLGDDRQAVDFYSEAVRIADLNDEGKPREGSFGRSDWLEFELLRAECKELPALPDRAERLLNEKRFAEAEAELRILADLDPANGAYRVQLGDALLKLRRYTEAATVFDQAINIDGGRYKSLNLAGLAYAELGGYHEASDRFTKAWSRRRDSLFAAHCAAIALFAANRKPELRRHCDEILEHRGSTTRPDALRNILHTFVFAPGNIDDPKVLLRLAESLGPDEAEYYSLAGAALYRNGKYSDAVSAIVKNGEPRGLDYCFLAMAHHRIGRQTDAQRWLSKARDWIAVADTPGSGVWRGWWDRVATNALFTEADALVNASAPKADGVRSALTKETSQ